jgi:CDP-diacylglycerol--glycerol-3-phosphate 3-phosphatidyltransferase/CDP-diacylglycerol--inositol 3-phosphatidyltransferase
MVSRLVYDRVAMLNRFRQFWTKVISPIANLLLKLGVSADAVTLVGTIGVCAGALIFFPRGHIWLGVVVITCFVLYYAGSAGHSRWMAAVTLWALVMGATTSYARAKAESLGLHASGGLAERSDRLVSVLVIGFFSDVLNLPILLKIVLCALAVASTITVVQRTLSVRKQVLSDPANAGLGTPPAGGATAGGVPSPSPDAAASGSAAGESAAGEVPPGDHPRPGSGTPPTTS